MFIMYFRKKLLQTFFSFFCKKGYSIELHKDKYKSHDLIRPGSSKKKMKATYGLEYS